MKFDRFAFDSNHLLTTPYHQWRSVFWPPADDYHVFCLDLTSRVPSLDSNMSTELKLLEAVIDAEWHYCNTHSANEEPRLKDAGLIAKSLRRIANLLPDDNDRRALGIRADAVERGYSDCDLLELAKIDEEISFVAGKISTWAGKQKGGLPTAFGCVRDSEGRAVVAEALKYVGDVGDYIFSLHKHLRLVDLPAFAPTNLFFMAGEGNRHPKHIAYFLPEDEGITRSPYNKTYYFVNTHRALVNAISLPLAHQLLDIGKALAPDASKLEPIPTLGVLAHEMGHAVHREGVNFDTLNSSDRWASLVLQETAADVFGFLILAEVLAPAFQFSPVDAVTYHLSECLRYVDRGLGCFPDSDGMYLQLNYLAKNGVLAVNPEGGRLLAGDPDVIIAGFRSLARVLADTLLVSDVRRSVSLYRTFGPISAGLTPLIAKLREGSPKTVEYLLKATFDGGSG